MSFLEPLLLVGLPLAALPILIHLINQRRFQTIDWGAMRFLLEANRMSRGFARIRRWLILACRTLAVAALVFVISRPLASGWLGIAGGNAADTTIVLLDRSPSMQQRQTSSAASKLETGLTQLIGALELTDSKRWVLIDSATATPREFDSPAALGKATTTTPVSASAHLPTLLQAAHDYISENRIGQTEVWILSDLRDNDWDAGNSRWQSLRDSFLQFKQGVRFHLLAYPESPTTNVGIRLTDVRRQRTNDGATLLLSLQFTSNSEGKTKLPVRFDIQGVSTEHEVEWEGPEFELRDFALPIADDLEQGWGRVSVPADAYPADDEFYFVFADAVPRQTLLVAEDGDAPRALQLAAAISPDPEFTNSVQVQSPAKLATTPWEELSLVLWQAPLPTGATASQLDQYVATGGQVIFLPPGRPNEADYRGARWTDWQETDGAVSVENWRSDQDLLARTKSGAALPVGELQIHRFCGLEGELTKLAWLGNEALLLARQPTTRGGVYFLATEVAPSSSSLATDGVVLYAVVQRALAAGAAERGTTRNAIAGQVAGEIDTDWKQIAGNQQALSTEYALVGGVYGEDERLVAVNRGAAEDTAEVLEDERINGLFNGLSFDMATSRAGDFAAIAREIWRVFLVLMLIALCAESLLCIPKAASPKGVLP